MFTATRTERHSPVLTPAGRVNDYAGLLSASDRERLESRLAERERATGAQVVVAVFRSLEGENLEDVSIRLAQQWRIGQKALDNGVILLVFLEDRKVLKGPEVQQGPRARRVPEAIPAKTVRTASSRRRQR